jgi:predicted acetyltransferase
MQIRTATELDLATLTQMGCESFPSGYGYEERLKLYKEHPRRKLERDVLVGEVDGRIVVSLSAIPYTIWLGGTTLPMLGIAGVANALDARRQGYASKLCIEAIKRGREQGYLISILYPFRYDFYKKLGWGAIGELIEYRFSPKNLTAYENHKNVRRFNTNDLELLMNCYQRFVEKHNCLAERPITVWQGKLKSIQDREAILMVYERDGKITGYLNFSFKSGQEMLSQEVIVNELIYEDKESYQGLLGFLATISDQVAVIRYWAQVEEAFHYLLKDPRNVEKPMLGGLVSKTGNYGLSYMLRVLHIEETLKSRTNYNNVTGTVTLEIEDEQIPENNGTFQLTFLNGKIEVSRVKIKNACIKLSIDVFSQIYSGAISLKKADFLGLVSVNQPSVVEWLSEALKLPKPFLQEFF